MTDQEKVAVELNLSMHFYDSAKAAWKRSRRIVVSCSYVHSLSVAFLICPWNVHSLFSRSINFHDYTLR